MQPKVVILSGGPNSVHLEGSPRVTEGFFEYCQENSVPVLRICYGMQVWMLQSCGKLDCLQGTKEKDRMGGVAFRQEALMLHMRGMHMYSCLLWCCAQLTYVVATHSQSLPHS